jgi:hypothetical protein
LFEKAGPGGVRVPVERFFPAETFPEAKAALLSHFDARCRWTLDARPGYFVAGAARRNEWETSGPETIEAAA